MSGMGSERQLRCNCLCWNFTQRKYHSYLLPRFQNEPLGPRPYLVVRNDVDADWTFCYEIDGTCGRKWNRWRWKDINCEVRNDLLRSVASHLLCGGRISEGSFSHKTIEGLCKKTIEQYFRPNSHVVRLYDHWLISALATLVFWDWVFELWVGAAASRSLARCISRGFIRWNVWSTEHQTRPGKIFWGTWLWKHIAYPCKAPS